jgi:NhaP-type Na+/H+ or K+/H+ antiporter
MKMVWIGLGFVLLLRPLTALAIMLKEKFNLKEKLAISFFGIRGMGSLFYLSFALNKASFQFDKELWSIVSFIIVLSILIHGVTATTVFQKLDHAADKKDLERMNGEKKG